MNIETKHILEKALELFQKFGIRSVSMDDISNQLGISKKTLYNNFKDKTDLVKQVEDYRFELKINEFHDIFNNFENAIMEMINLQKAFNTYIQNFSRSYEYDLKKYFSEIYCEKHNKRTELIAETFKNNIKKGINEGLYRSNLNINILVDYYVYFMMCMTDKDWSNQHSTKISEYFNEVFMLHLYGILSDNGKKQYEKINKTIIKAD